MGKDSAMKCRVGLAVTVGLALGVCGILHSLQKTDLVKRDILHRTRRAVGDAGNSPSTSPPTSITSSSATTTTILDTTTPHPPSIKPHPSTKPHPATTKDEARNPTTTNNKGKARDEGKTTSSSTRSTTPTTTTTTPPLPCSERPFPLAAVCTLSRRQQEAYLGSGVVLEELADTFFNTMVLDALATRCGNATWCLGYDLDKDLILGDSQVYMQYCDLQECLRDIPQECITNERKLVIQTLGLLCNARMLNVSDRCMLGIKKMTHVALVDEVVTVNETGPICSISETGECAVGCVGLGQQLMCMWNACYDEMDSEAFSEFGQWRWVLHGTMDNSTDVCGQNNTQCPAFSDSTVLNLKVFQQMLYRIQQTGPAVLAGIITALVVTVAGFGIIFWACAKKVYVYYEYSRDRVEYTEVSDSTHAQFTEVSDSDEEVELHPA